MLCDLVVTVIGHVHFNAEKLRQLLIWQGSCLLVLDGIQQGNFSFRKIIDMKPIHKVKMQIRIQLPQALGVVRSAVLVWDYPSNIWHIYQPFPQPLVRCESCQKRALPFDTLGTKLFHFPYVAFHSQRDTFIFYKRDFDRKQDTRQHCCWPFRWLGH